MKVKQVNICLNPDTLKIFDEKIHPVHRSTALEILINSFIISDKGISDFQKKGAHDSKKKNHRRSSR